MADDLAMSERQIATRKERLEARISAEEKALFVRAAEMQGRTLTDFVVASVHEMALRTLRDSQAMRLSDDESRAFAEALLSPRMPGARLQSAAQRYMASAAPSRT